MASLTVRNIPDRVLQRIKQLAKGHGHSMEQEVRQILLEKSESRSDLFERIQHRAERLPSPTAGEVDAWMTEARNRSRS